MGVTFYPNYIHDAEFDETAEPSIVTQNYASSGGETTGPAYDLVDNKRDNILTVDTNGESTDFTIDFDLTNDISSVDFLIMDNVNLGGAHAEVKITHQGTDIDPSAVWGLILGDGGVEQNPITVASYYTNWEYYGDEDLYLWLISAITDNNWEFVFRDFEGSNYAADITIGEIFIGKKFETNIVPRIHPSSRYGVNTFISKGGHKYGFEKHGRIRRWTMHWAYMTAAEKTSLETVWAITRGQRFAFYIDFGLSTDPALYLVRFAMDELIFEQVAAGDREGYACTIIVEEEI